MKSAPANLSNLLLAAVLLIGAGTAALAADPETYVLAKKRYVSPDGTVMTKEFSMDMKDAAMNISAGGNRIPGSMTRLELKKEKLEVISPIKLRLTATEKTITGSMTVNGQEQPSPDEPEPLLDKPVIFDLKDGKWSTSLEDGAEPTATQRKSLDEKADSANKDADFEMYGDAPRKVGDEWKVDPAKIGFGGGKDLTGEYVVRFVEVKEIEGVKCAVLKATFDFQGKMDSEPGGPDLNMGMKGEAVSIRSIADLQDVDVRINATMTMEGAPAEGVSMHVEGPMIGVQKIAIKRP